MVQNLEPIDLAEMSDGSAQQNTGSLSLGVPDNCYRALK